MKYLFSTLSVLIYTLVFVPSVFASSLSLTTPQKEVSIGEEFTVEVKLNSGAEQVNAFSAFVSYPGDILEVKKIQTSSIFAISAEEKILDSQIKITKGSITPVSGENTVATLVLRAKTSGLAALSFLPDSAVPSAEDNKDTLTEKSPLTIQVKASSDSKNENNSSGSENENKDNKPTPSASGKSSPTRPKGLDKNVNWPYLYVSLLKLMVTVWASR